MSVTHKTLGQLATLPQIEKALRDMEVERRQIVDALNIFLADSPAGQLLLPFTDDTGTPAMYRLIAGAGITLTFDTAAQTCTITSP